MSEYYIFKLSENVSRTHVRYKNRYGIELAGDLYMAKNREEGRKYPALVVGAPYGGVKEQGPGVYANELAQRGFVVLTFDPSFKGESGGEPRQVSSPEIFSEDFSAGVDYLGTRPFVNREQIGAIGICGSGGFALSAAQMDSRIKAVATASMYDISAMRGTMSQEELSYRIDELSRKRFRDFEKGEPEYIPSFPETPADAIPEGLDSVGAEFFSFYGLKRGHHPNARAGHTTTSDLSFLNYQLLNHIDTISPRPILFIMGENAHSRFFSENAYAAAAEPKELCIVPNAIHIDLYDDIEKIPFSKMEDFFMTAFKSE
ncbi:alpha/beta hydrolase [Clostridium transplantifaecale]|uniref:alpha/beta hydrolase n=1 Tax=Clostridium transplantifaecale TaxID=2479838 RepID=UPI000F6415ED|nr:alpha/beta hydrolase [Clostridium transplantifaecale]